MTQHKTSFPFHILAKIVFVKRNLIDSKTTGFFSLFIFLVLSWHLILLLTLAFLIPASPPWIPYSADHLPMFWSVASVIDCPCQDILSILCPYKDILLFLNLLFFNNHFYWNTVNSQCCVSFRCIANWFNSVYFFSYSVLL